MKTLIKTLILTIIAISTAHAQLPTDKDSQIKMAILAGPEELRNEATILGFNEKGEMVTIREGTNEMICRSDDPSNPNFETVCYHKDLEPFMARGRELHAEDKGMQEIFDIREAEVQSGKLKMPEKPTTLHILYGGPDVTYDKVSGTLSNAYYRYVIYIPYATEESTGLPLKPNGPGHPWLMNPGTHRAHIMITPPKNKDN